MANVETSSSTAQTFFPNTTLPALSLMAANIVSWSANGDQTLFTQDAGIQDTLITHVIIRNTTTINAAQTFQLKVNGSAIGSATTVAAAAADTITLLTLSAPVLVKAGVAVVITLGGTSTASSLAKVLVAGLIQTI